MSLYRTSGGSAVLTSIVLTAALAFSVVVVAGASPTRGKFRAEPSGITLTDSGTLTLRFESLLREEFGTRPVCTLSVPVEREASLDFPLQNNDCAPLARYNPYFYTFRSTEVPHLRLISKKLVPGSLGDYAVPIKIGAYFVECSTAPLKYLFQYVDTSSWTLGCKAPE
jgi:hypothetical protein